MSIRLVVSDVDGTIVQPDKSVSPSTVAAAKRLGDAGIPLAIVSARPPRGMRFIAEQLGLDAAFAGFNGGATVKLDGTVLAWLPTPRAAVDQALALYKRRGIDTWLFTEDEWLLRDASGDQVAREVHTVRFDPRVVDSFDPYLDQVGKLVGVSHDYAMLAEAERELQDLVGTTATAHRSQDYYLDLTHPDANKGHAVRALAKTFGVDLAEIAVLGDMANDIPMFTVAGYSVAMGNGSADAKKAATDVTEANDRDGWAQAIDTLILPKVAR